jgi:hypothetical protein
MPMAIPVQISFPTMAFIKPNIPYFPTYKTHFFSPKKWPRFELRLTFINTRTSISDASSENCEDDFSGSDDDFQGFYDE